MKKKGKIIAVVALVIAIVVGLWFYVYFSRKSIDNIPSKDLIVSCYLEKGEEYASQMLNGYTRSQLLEAWGERQGLLSGFWGEIWDAEDNWYIIVYFQREDGYGNEDARIDRVKVSQKEA